MFFNTGKYLVRFYTQYGQKIKELDEICETYEAGVEQGREVIEAALEAKLQGDSVPVSYSVDRRVYNSLDRLERW